MRNAIVNNRLSLCVLVVLAIPKIAPGAPCQTSSIALAPHEKMVGAVNQDAASVSLWDWSQEESVRMIGVGEEPRTLAFSPNGRWLYVANQCSQTLSVVDLDQSKSIKEIQIGGQPYGVLVSPDGVRAIVSQYAGGYVEGKYREGIIAVVDLRSHEPIARIPVRARPWAMALNADGSLLYVTHYLSIGAQGWVTQIDIARQAVVREIPLAEDDKVRDGQGGIFNALATIAIHPSRDRAVVGGMHANVRRGFALNHQRLSHKTTVQAAVRLIDLHVGQELDQARVLSSFHGQAAAVPSAVAFLGKGEYYLDVYFASNDFKVIQYNERGVVAERALRSLPAGPTGVTVTRDGKTAFFCSRWDRSLSQFSLADPRKPQMIKTVRACAEPWDAERLRGAVLFHTTRDTRMTANRWMSCAVCHLEGGLVSDGLTWDLTLPGAPAKIGNTMDLVNMPHSSPPFFHRGEAEVVQTLERFVLDFQQGSGFLGAQAAPPTAADSGQGDTRDARAEEGAIRDMRGTTSPEWAAMLAYMRAMRSRPNPHREGDQPRPEIRAAVERGRKLFLDPTVGCSRCHQRPAAAPQGQPSRVTLFDVGTGSQVDTPSLMNLWDTAPYLHDGRAATLLDVLTTHNRQDRHGKTSHLDRGQWQDLVSFLLASVAEEGP